jgi:hypothetical protein
MKLNWNLLQTHNYNLFIKILTATGYIVLDTVYQLFYKFLLSTGAQLHLCISLASPCFYFLTCVHFSNSRCCTILHCPYYCYVFPLCPSFDCTWTLTHSLFFFYSFRLSYLFLSLEFPLFSSRVPPLLLLSFFSLCILFFILLMNYIGLLCWFNFLWSIIFPITIRSIWIVAYVKVS